MAKTTKHEHAITLRRLKRVPDSETDPAFLQRMIDAMGLSWFKYGAVAEAYPAKVDAVESLKMRLQKYADTGNTEFLVDVANFAMIEFMHPKHPQAHYKAEDAGGPGRVWASGRVDESANTIGRENVRRGGSNRVTTGGFYAREGD